MKHGQNTDGDKFLIFDFRFLIGSGEKFGAWKQAAGPEAGVPTKTREAGSWGKRRGFTALSGREIGKTRNFYRLATGFSHFETALTRLLPHNSTQVVDFPHLAMVRLFWGQHKMLATDETRIKHGCRNDGLIRKAGTEEKRNGQEEGLTTNGQRWTRIWKRPGMEGSGADGVHVPAHPHSELPGWRPSVRVCSPMFA